VVAERDVVRALAARGAAVLDQAVGEITSNIGVVCAPDDPITGVMATMTNRRVRHLPVIAGRKMVGLISIGDVVKHRLHEIEEEANTLRDYITAR
jgi:CBS domain-containing protein